MLPQIQVKLVQIIESISSSDMLPQRLFSVGFTKVKPVTCNDKGPLARYRLSSEYKLRNIGCSTRTKLCPGLTDLGSNRNGATSRHSRNSWFADRIARPSTSQQHGLFWRAEHIVPDRHGALQHACLRSGTSQLCQLRRRSSTRLLGAAT